jgi:hypothetical protein
MCPQSDNLKERALMRGLDDWARQQTAPLDIIKEVSSK